MSIQNGDGVNKNGPSRNKVLYFNEYERNDIANGTTPIPIKIKVKSSCKLANIKVYFNSVENEALLAHMIKD